MAESTVKGELWDKKWVSVIWVWPILNRVRVISKLREGRMEGNQGTGSGLTPGLVDFAGSMLFSINCAIFD